MATKREMDHSGDTRYDLMRIARRRCRKQKTLRSYQAVGFTAGKEEFLRRAVVTGRFDPSAEETIFFPRLVCG